MGALRKADVEPDAAEIHRMLVNKLRRSGEAHLQVKLLARKVHRYWKRIAPVGDPTGARYVENFGGPLPKHWQQVDANAGDYKAGIIMERVTKKRGGVPAYKIAATDYKSHWIEYGTGGDTPTPEFAVRQRVALRFGAAAGVSKVTDKVDRPWKKTIDYARTRGVDVSRKKQDIKDRRRRIGVTKLLVTGPVGDIPEAKRSPVKYKRIEYDD